MKKNAPKSLITIFLVFFLIQNSYSQFNKPFGARQAAMGNSAVVLSDIWSSYHNQAGLSKLDGITGGVHFSNAYNIKDIGTKTFAFGMPVSNIGNFGVNYTYFGYDLRNESKFGLAYAMALGKRFSAGVQIDYFLVRQGFDYGKKGTAVGEIGILAEPFDNFFVGAHLFNPWRSKLANYQDERVPTLLKFGIGYEFSEKVIMTMEVEKDIDLETIVKSGLEYNVVAGLFLRTGVSTNPVLYSFGLGYNYIDIQFDIAFINHEFLGYTSQFGLSYIFKGLTKEKSAYNSE